MPAVKTAPFTPSDTRPRMNSSALARAAPVFARTADDSSFNAHVSPAAVSKPAALIRWRAVTPAWSHVDAFADTHAAQPFQLISSRAWKFAPRARICDACPARACDLPPASGGTQTEYTAPVHGDS